MKVSDYARGIELWQRIGGRGNATPIFEDLFQRYSEPHRHYHNFNHILAVLNEFDAARSLCTKTDEVEAAIWFHDAIYDPKAKDNEARSADLASAAFRKSGISPEVIDRVADLILATQHGTPSIPNDVNTDVLLDADLSILGKPESEFNQYEVNIRKEYAWVAEDAFRAGRTAVLQSFLRRPQIYSTNFFRIKYEQHARVNLERSIRALAQH